jgi:hypothetical protein
MAGGDARPERAAAPAFATEELRAYLSANARAMPPGYEEIAAVLDGLAKDVERLATDLEALEQRLTVLEEKMIAHARAGQSEERALASRQELDRQLRPYRSKMTAAQLGLLEKQYLDRNLLEQAGLPRLSLFYMR